MICRDAMVVSLTFLLAACAGPQGVNEGTTRETDFARSPQVDTLYLSNSLRIESQTTNTSGGRLKWVMTLKNISGKQIDARMRPRYYGADGRELVKGPIYHLKVEHSPGQSVTLTDTCPVPGAGDVRPNAPVSVILLSEGNTRAQVNLVVEGLSRQVCEDNWVTFVISLRNPADSTVTCSWRPRYFFVVPPRAVASITALTKFQETETIRLEVK